MSSDCYLDIGTIFKNNNFIAKKGYFKKNKKKIRNIDQTTWVDKYRPRTLNDIIGHDEVKNVLTSSIKKGDLPHLLFHGNAGTGKTSTVTALVTQLYGYKMSDNVLELNASDENGINVVRDKIIRFANIIVGSVDPKYQCPSFKIIILDEADSMTSEAQTALKKVMESTCDITRFVFICNYENRIIEAIKSRCASFRFNPIPDHLIIKKLKEISKKENLKIDDKALRVITDICEGDARRSINTLQNIKYIPGIKMRKIKKGDIHDITSYIEKDFFDIYWNTILSGTVDELTRISLKIINTGYPINYILNCIKDRTIETCMNDKQISKILIHIANIERMITNGSNNNIQLLSIFAQINGVYKNLDILDPKIF